MLGFYQPISSWTHLLGALITLCTGAILIRRGWGNQIRVGSLIVFMIGIILMFTMSGVYHALEPGLGRQVFRRLDYAAIFVMIAGTATPIHVIMFRGWWRWGMLIYLWVVAIVGLLLTVILIDQIPEWATLSVFMALGWTALASILKAGRLYGFMAIRLALLGGLFYSIGAAIDFLRWPELVPGFIGSHEIFHVFVMLGAAAHWKLIYNWADQPTHTRLVFLVKEKSENELFARAVGESIFVSATSRQELRTRVKEKLDEQFHPRLIPAKIRFRYYRDVVMKMGA
ncbi:MAG TPA: hemolysin III family protein [Flavobacteriales bacterium]|nr:hemolysin III family protein [Flavobacteriales bacterium]HPH82447.1 hemolysin III family protein [Flavobacteriales bacterium]